MPGAGIYKILIVKPSALGDIVHSLPFLNAIKDCFADAEIHWVVGRGLEGLLANHPQITRLWVIDKTMWKKLSRFKTTIGEMNELFKSLQGERYDLVVDLQGLFRSGFIAAAAKSKRCIGFKEAREGSGMFYTDTVEGGRDAHAIDRYMKIAAYLGCGTGGIKYVFPPLPSLQSLNLGLPPSYAVISPSAGKEANRWPAERFGELAARLPIKSVVVSGKSDSHIADRVKELSKGNAISLAGKTDLLSLASVIKGAKFMVSNDTGPMHIAAAFDIPVFALFGPANPVRTGPYGKIHTVIREPMDCSPCYKKKKCRKWRCMEAISVDRVYGEIMKNFG